MTAEAIAIRKDQTPDGGPSLSDFLLEHGRLPYITDEIKPWHYSGWIVAYIQLCESSPLVAPRYDYVMRTVDAGRLLDEPIPQVDFIGEGSPEAREGMKMLEKMVQVAEYGSGFSRGFDEILKWLGFGLGVTAEKTTMPETEQEQLYRIFDVSKWLTAPTDYLGSMMAERGYGRAAAFFPTPMTICTMMAMMDSPPAEDHRAKTVSDPCVGTGRLLLAASNYSLRLSGQDIMWAAIMATKINLAIYAPWSLIPEGVFSGSGQSVKLPAEIDGIGPSSEFREEKDVAVGRERIFNRERLWGK